MSSKTYFVILFCVLLLSVNGRKSLRVLEKEKCDKDELNLGTGGCWTYTGLAKGAGLGIAAVVGFPFLLGAAGFGAGGIAAGSLAAKGMSIVATANGGGVAAGGVMATLQSIGAAGLGAASKVGIVAGSSALYGYSETCDDDDEKK